MYYHATQTKGIHVLEPRISNHNIPLIYFSKKRENTLVYLSNAVEKYCKENGFSYDGIWSKWGPYGFDNEGILQIEEYYPNAIKETYEGVSGYIYSCAEIERDPDFELNIPDAVVSRKKVEVTDCEYIGDAYAELIHAEQNGRIKIVPYEDFIAKREDWLKTIINSEYKGAAAHPEYQFFLRAKFAEYLDDGM